MEDAGWISRGSPRTNYLKATRNGNGITILFVKNSGDKGSIVRKVFKQILALALITIDTRINQSFHSIAKV